MSTTEDYNGLGKDKAFLHLEIANEPASILGGSGSASHQVAGNRVQASGGVTTVSGEELSQTGLWPR